MGFFVLPSLREVHNGSDCLEEVLQFLLSCIKRDVSDWGKYSNLLNTLFDRLFILYFVLIFDWIIVIIIQYRANK